MKLVHFGFVAAIAALQQRVAAWNISSSDAVAPTNPIDAHETLTKTWTIAGDQPLNSISLFTFGRVFIEYDASLASTEEGAPRIAAKVIFSGNDTDLLDAFEVVDDKEDAKTVQIRIRNDDLDTQGYLLTRVLVADKQSVHAIAQAASSDLIIGEDVVVQHDASANVSLALVGSGNVYFGSPDAEFSLAVLNVALVGSGDVQVVAKSIDLASTLSLAVAGSGDVAVVADSVTVNESVVVAIAGSGDTFVQSEQLSTYNLSTLVAGSGSATFTRAGACQEQDISIVGSGDVSSASIQAVNTRVNLAGSGDVLVQTSGNLSVSSIFGSGDVRYYGAEPAVINVDSSLDFFGHGKKQKVKKAKKIHFDEYEVEPAPAKELVFLRVKITKSYFGSDQPSIHHVSEGEASMGIVSFQTQSMAAHGVVHGVGIFMVVGAAFAAVGVAAARYKRRADRARYQPLV